MSQTGTYLSRYTGEQVDSAISLIEGVFKISSLRISSSNDPSDWSNLKQFKYIRKLFVNTSDGFSTDSVLNFLRIEIGLGEELYPILMIKRGPNLYDGVFCVKEDSKIYEINVHYLGEIEQDEEEHDYNVINLKLTELKQTINE